MPERTYPCFVYRQRERAPLQVAFVAPSSEIDNWARVPTKRTGNVRNFQRAEIPQHVREVERFFRESRNASPTAIVIGFEPIRAKEHVALLDGAGNELEEKEISPGRAHPAQLVINTEHSEVPDDHDGIKDFIQSRQAAVEGIVLKELHEITGLHEKAIGALLAEVRQRTLNGTTTFYGTTASIEDADDGNDVDDSEEDDDDIENLSESARELMSGLTPSERQILVGRLEFVCQLERTVLDRHELSNSQQLARAVVDELKPGILIDGQHRVMGTKGLGEVPFLVCALPSAEWPELAFQFLVTNRTSRRVQESLLINIVGNSLSQTQRANIEDRLRDAGIRVGLIEAVMKIHEDVSSPFYGMLAFGLKDERGFIDAAAMRNKVVKQWFERQGVVQKLFDHLCIGVRKKDRTEYWKSKELWFDFFVAFWSAVRGRYEGSQVFSAELRDDSTKREPVSSLMTATVLKIFQEAVLRNIFEYVTQKQQKEGVTLSVSIADSTNLGGLVSRTLTPLSPEFFQGWSLSGFDGSAGAKTDLDEAIELVISQKKTVGQLKSRKNPHRLFKEKP